MEDKGKSLKDLKGNKRAGGAGWGGSNPGVTIDEIVSRPQIRATLTLSRGPRTSVNSDSLRRKVLKCRTFHLRPNPPPPPAIHPLPPHC